MYFVLVCIPIFSLHLLETLLMQHTAQHRMVNQLAPDAPDKFHMADNGRFPSGITSE